MYTNMDQATLEIIVRHRPEFAGKSLEEVRAALKIQYPPKTIGNHGDTLLSSHCRANPSLVRKGPKRAIDCAQRPIAISVIVCETLFVLPTQFQASALRRRATLITGHVTQPQAEQ
jgi:hypothetical protein